MVTGNQEMIINHVRTKFNNLEPDKIKMKKPPCINCLIFSKCYSKANLLHRLECTLIHNWLAGDLIHQQIRFDQLSKLFESPIYVIWRDKK